MKAVVLCAGLGTRLGSLTEKCPKPLLPIQGHPLLAYILGSLKRSCCDEVAINLHYFPEQIRNYFGDGSKFGMKLHYSYEPELLGTAGALWKLKNWLGNEEDFLVLYGDILTDQNLRSLLEIHRQQESFATLLLHHRSISNSIVKLNDEGQILLFSERPDMEERYRLCGNDTGGWVNSAVQVLSQRCLNYIGQTKAYDLPRDVYVAVADKERLIGVPLTGRRVAIDSLERYSEAQALVSDGGLFALHQDEFHG
jgi:mannose-1-phosphate guanylyltransferase/phosphomannomutase